MIDLKIGQKLEYVQNTSKFSYNYIKQPLEKKEDKISLNEFLIQSKHPVDLMTLWEHF